MDLHGKIDRPNVILINCDDLGYGDLGCYGSTVNRTPTLDFMAENGLRLTDFYMASPICSPSRGGMLTGCYPPRIGFGDFDGHGVLFPGQGIGLNRNETTIASMLKISGYRTKIVGKWHCGDQPEFLPTKHGFDEYYGLPYSNDMGRQVTVEHNPPLPLLCNETVIQQQPDLNSLTERYVEQCTDFIRRSKDESFFLYLAHMHVHLPLYVAERFAKESRNGNYGACVECIDWATSCILHQLRESGIENNTLIIFTSDNGSRGDNGGSNYPLRGRKGTTWEGGIRLPCIMYWPGTIKPGRISNQILSAIDFLPTLANICEANLGPNVIDGVDFSALLTNSDAPSVRNQFFYYLRNDLEAVREGDWKLHVRKSDEQVGFLFNLQEDIGEECNLYDENPDVVERLEMLLEECRVELGDAALEVCGRGNRPKGRVENPKPLTAYDEDHPYIVAMYDRAEVG